MLKLRSATITRRWAHQVRLVVARLACQSIRARSGTWASFSSKSEQHPNSTRMISNSSLIPTLHGAQISLAMVKAPMSTRDRRTKIVCTMGPACWSEESLGKLMDAGMNVARFNFSHGDHEGHGAVLDRLRKVAAEKSRNIAVLLDTKGPEIRTGFFANGANKIELTKGERIVLTADYHFRGDKTKLACSYEALASSVRPGQQILVADGSLVLTVLITDTSTREVVCRIENNAQIGERKNMNLPGVKVDLPTFTEKDVHDIVTFGIARKVEFIAASFIRKADDVKNLRKLLSENGGQDIKIISKIENQEGMENYDSILQETDAIMVARGDLGMEIPAQKVFLAQKWMIRAANIAGKPVITATQMLESMVNSPRPTRAECSDVANAVFDGTDAVMLSGETANGPYFEQAVNFMSRTVCQAELSRNYNLIFQSIRNSIMKRYGHLSVGESMASSAVKTAIDVNAKLIVVVSRQGRVAGYVAKFRPCVSCLMVTTDLVAARQASGLLLGVHTVQVDSLEETEELIEEISYELVQSKAMAIGDSIVVIGGKKAGMKEQLRIVQLSEGKSHGHFVKGGVEGQNIFFNRQMLLTFEG